MLDLTKIEKPFALLDKETQSALRAHHLSGGVIETFGVDGWVHAPLPAFICNSTYRAKPEPIVLKARYGVGKVYASGYHLPSISAGNFGADRWRAMTGEIVVGDDGWPVSITLTRETEQC